MNCPGCDAEIVDPEGGKEEVLRVCAECGGLTVELADLKPLLLHNNLPGIESLGGRVVKDADTGVCPTCQVDLTLFEGGDRQQPEFYEVCEECGCVFIDGDSLDPELEPEKRVASFFSKFAAAVKKSRSGP
ncbi:MAG: hypothetical protein HY901_06875 [Deltaproteobacteria bacterium]|nr:hypothetical protein [Deltaproteobacteria bacterium]